jgi:hypothetical protein
VGFGFSGMDCGSGVRQGQCSTQPGACAWACYGAIAVRLLIPAQPGIRRYFSFRRKRRRQPRRDGRADAARPLPRRIGYGVHIDSTPAVYGDEQAPPALLHPAVQVPQLQPQPWPEDDMDVRIKMSVSGVHGAQYTPSGKGWGKVGRFPTEMSNSSCGESGIVSVPKGLRRHDFMRTKRTFAIRSAEGSSRQLSISNA